MNSHLYISVVKLNDIIFNDYDLNDFQVKGFEKVFCEESERSSEWQDELGLNMYAMDMRMYDPAIARWVVQDPVIHHSMSPYNSFDNNPVFWADPSGADSENNLWEIYDKDKKEPNFTDHNVIGFSTTYVNENTGESVWINDGVNEIVLVGDRLFAKAKVFKAYFGEDRKSTRLNSSHVAISYAVFCLKKKN